MGALPRSGEFQTRSCDKSVKLRRRCSLTGGTARYVRRMICAGFLDRPLRWLRGGWRVPLSTAKWVCMVVFVVGVVIGVTGLWSITKLGPFGDMIALALPTIGLSALTVGVWCIVTHRPWMVVAAFAALFVVAAVAVVVPRLPDTTGPATDAITLVAANLLHDNRTIERGVASAMAQHPDVLVVSELNKDSDRLLSAKFPYRLVTERSLRRENYAEGVYSTFPLEELDAPTGLDDQMLRVRVTGPAPFILYAVHLPRPTFGAGGRDGSHSVSFAQNRRDALRLDSLATAEGEPVVIAGDLNLSDRTSGYAALHSDRNDAVRTRWATTSYVGGFIWELFALRIDHIFIPKTWCAANGGSFEIAGSDHAGVRSSIGPCA